MNIPVLIVHAISLIFLKRFDEAYNRMMALDKYASRHLKEGEDTFRSYCFIKALQQIALADFSKNAAREKAKQLLKAVATKPLQMINAPHEIEIVPYEHLWDMALEGCAD